MSFVHPVPILSAVLCVICCVLMFVSHDSGGGNDSSMGIVMALYVAMIVSFCFPHVVVVIYMCLLYVSLGSRVSPSIFGLMCMGRVMLSMCSSSCVLYSSGSGVKRVHVVLSGLRVRLFVHVCISCTYDV